MTTEERRQAVSALAELLRPHVVSIEARRRARPEKIAELRCRKADLQQAMDREQLAEPTADDLASIRDKVKEAIESGSAQERKGLLQALVAEVRVQRRSEIYPVFWLPRGGVREVYGLVDPRGFEPLTS
jgi:hypothetical protein